MKGNTNWQVQQIYGAIKGIGESRHDAKAEARSGGAKTTAEVSKLTKIHSYATADAYRSVWRSIGEFAKTEFGMKNMEKLEGRHVAAFLESKIHDGVSRATFDQYGAATAKLEAALNRYATQNDTGGKYKFDLKTVRALGVKELGARNHEPRAYSDPMKILSRLDGEHQLAARLQIESGGRVKEVSQIRETQLRGLQTERTTGELKGLVHVDGKGGKERELQISPATYAELKSAIAAGDGVFRMDDYKEYLQALQNAADETGQSYNGSHGLRWGFAQERMGELQKNGLTFEGALLQVSEEMGHARSDITEHYLK